MCEGTAHKIAPPESALHSTNSRPTRGGRRASLARESAADVLPTIIAPSNVPAIQLIPVSFTVTGLNGDGDLLTMEDPPAVAPGAMTTSDTIGATSPKRDLGGEREGTCAGLEANIDWETQSLPALPRTRRTNDSSDDDSNPAPEQCSDWDPEVG